MMMVLILFLLGYGGVGIAKHSLIECQDFESAFNLPLSKEGLVYKCFWYSGGDRRQVLAGD